MRLISAFTIFLDFSLYDIVEIINSETSTDEQERDEDIGTLIFEIFWIKTLTFFLTKRKFGHFTDV